MAQYISNFNPLSVAGCVLWVDATDLNIGVVSDGSVKDKSGTNATLTTSGNVWTVTDAQEPFVGKKVFRNTSAGLSSEYLAASTGTTQPINTISATSTIYAVYSVCDKLSGTFSGTSTLFGSYGRVNLYINDTTTKRSINNNNTSYDNISCSRSAGSLSVLATTMTLYAPISEAAGGNSGVQVVTSGLGTNNITQNPGANIWGVFGNPFVIGNNWSVATSQSWVGCIAEILIYKSQLSAVEKLKIDGYLAAKWGAPLPATHPYYRATFTQTPPPFLRPFNPVEVSTPMMFRFDASDASTVTTSAGTSTVTRWGDNSGNGNYIATFTGTPPTYSQVNGSITFPASSIGRTENNTVTNLTNYSGFAVVTWDRNSTITHDGNGIHYRVIKSTPFFGQTANYIVSLSINRNMYGTSFTNLYSAKTGLAGFAGSTNEGTAAIEIVTTTASNNENVIIADNYYRANNVANTWFSRICVLGTYKLKPFGTGLAAPPISDPYIAGRVVSGSSSYFPLAYNTGYTTGTRNNIADIGAGTVFTLNARYFIGIDYYDINPTTTSFSGATGTLIKQFAQPTTLGANNATINPAAGKKLVVYWERSASNQVGGSVNGNYVSGITPLKTTTSTLTNTYQIGSPGNSTTGIDDFPLELHEVIMFDGALSSLDRQKMEAHLIWKWGAQRDSVAGVDTFPSDNPYYKYIPDTVTPYNPAAKLNGTTPTLALWFDAAEPASIVQSGTLLTRWKNKAQSFGNIQKDQLAVANGANYCAIATAKTVGSSTTVTVTLLNPTTYPIFSSGCVIAIRGTSDDSMFGLHTLGSGGTNSSFTITISSAATIDVTGGIATIVSSPASFSSTGSPPGLSLALINCNVSSPNITYTDNIDTVGITGIVGTGSWGNGLTRINGYTGIPTGTINFLRGGTFSAFTATSGNISLVNGIINNISSAGGSGSPFIITLTNAISGVQSGSTIVILGSGSGFDDGPYTVVSTNAPTNFTTITLQLRKTGSAVTYSGGFIVFVRGGINVPYTPSSKNGLPALDLSSRSVNYMISEAATNNCFTTSGFTNQLSVFIVMSQATKPTSTTANIYDIFSTFPTVGNFRMFFTSGSRFSPTLNSYTQGAYPPEPSWGVNAFNIYEVTYNPASGWLYSYINGQGETGASLINLYGTALTESQWFRLFPGTGLDGKLCEVLVFNETLNTQDRQRVEGYLATKWDLQSLLPTGHPYYKVKI